MACALLQQGLCQQALRLQHQPGARGIHRNVDQRDGLAGGVRDRLEGAVRLGAGQDAVIDGL